MPENLNPDEQQKTQTAEEIAAAAKEAGIELPPEGIQLPPGETGDEPELPSDDDAPPAERPAWLPEKFKTVEDMAKAYTELEKKQGAGDQQQEETPPADGNPRIPETPDVKAAVDIVQKAGLDLAKLNETYAKEGTLAEADYEALGKQGVPKALVDSFIKGQIALQQKAADETAKAAYEAAGSQEKYVEAVQWAAKNLDRKAIESFNRTIDGNDAAAVQLAVSGLMAKFVAAGGAEPKNLQTGERTQAGGYSSKAEMQKDMGDPRYATDPAFRARVEQKVARTTAF